MAETWIGGMGGWHTIVNWSGAIRNSYTADAIIATSGTVTLEAGLTDQVDTLLLNNAAAALNLAGSLLLDGLAGCRGGALLIAGNLSSGTL